MNTHCRPWTTQELDRDVWGSNCRRASTLSSRWLGRRWWITLLTIVAAANSLLSQTVTSQSPAGAGQSAPPSRHLQRGSASFHLFGPGVIAVDADGNVYAAAPDGVFKIDPSGDRTRVAGIERDRHYSGDGGPAIGAGLNPRGMAIDAGGNLYLAGAGNLCRIRRAEPSRPGVIATVAGDGVRGFTGDGSPATSAQLDGPTGVAVDTKGDVYIADGTADGTNRIRKITVATGVITTIAGNGSQGYSGDGESRHARPVQISWRNGDGVRQITSTSPTISIIAFGWCPRRRGSSQPWRETA